MSASNKSPPALLRELDLSNFRSRKSTTLAIVALLIKKGQNQNLKWDKAVLVAVMRMCWILRSPNSPVPEL